MAIKLVAFTLAQNVIKHSSTQTASWRLGTQTKEKNTHRIQENRNLHYNQICHNVIYNLSGNVLF